MPANAMGTVNVSFDPVSASLGDTFDDARGAAVPRFIASDNTQNVLDISLCTYDAAVPVRAQHARLRYRTGHHEYLVGSRLLHHRLQRFRCS